MTQERFAITGCRPRKSLGILLLLAMVGRAHIGFGRRE